MLWHQVFLDIQSTVLRKDERMKKKNNISEIIEKIRQFLFPAIVSDTSKPPVLKTVGKVIKTILYLLIFLALMDCFIMVSTVSCNVSISSSEYDWITFFALIWSLCAISKNRIVKRIELILYLLVLFVFLWSNIWYFRGFHEHAFLLAVILCIIQCVMYFYAQKTKKRYFFYSLISGFLLFFIIYFNFKNDIHLCPSTDLRYYKEDMGEKTESGYGIFPDTIPEEAKEIEYFSTTGGYMWIMTEGENRSSTYLKMTVNDEYLHHLLEVAYRKSEKHHYLDKQDCSVITSNDPEYLPWENLDKYVEEFYGKENCTLYLISSINMGFVIDWDEKVVKIFDDGKF